MTFWKLVATHWREMTQHPIWVTEIEINIGQVTHCTSPLPMVQQPPQWARVSSLSRLHHHRQSTLGRTPLDKLADRCRDLYLTTHNTHNTHTHARASGGIRTRNPNKQTAADPRLRLSSHWNRHPPQSVKLSNDQWYTAE